MLPMLFLVKELMSFLLPIKLKNDVLSCYHIFETNSVVHLKYGTTPYFFSRVTNIKHQHRKDLLTTLF